MVKDKKDKSKERSGPVVFLEKPSTLKAQEYKRIEEKEKEVIGEAKKINPKRGRGLGRTMGKGEKKEAIHT